MYIGGGHVRDKPLFISSVIVTVIYMAFIIVLFTPLRGVFSPFITAAVLVYLLAPFVRRLEKWGVKSTAATFIVYAVILTAGSFILLYAAPKIYSAVLKIAELLAQYMTDAAGERLRGALFEGGMGRIYTTVISATKGALNTIVSFAAAFYILCDMKNVKEALKEFIPLKLVAPLRVISDDVKSSFDSFFTGQLLIAAILFVIDGIFLYAVKIPYSWGLAFIAAVLDIIPYAGATVAIGIIILITIISAKEKLLVVVTGLLLIQQLENNYITPKISSETLAIHPAVTVLALYTGAYGGFWGILLAIPLVCVFKRLFIRFIQAII